MERNISFTAKTKDNTLITIRADEPEEFVARVANAFINDDFINAITLAETVIRHANSPAEVRAVNNVVTAMGGEVISTPETPSFAPVAPPVNAQAAAPAPTVSGERQCAHGVMVKRTGQGQYGEWRGYFCPTPKGTADQCKPVYLKKQQVAEWNAF